MEFEPLNYRPAARGAEAHRPSGSRKGDRQGTAHATSGSGMIDADRSGPHVWQGRALQASYNGRDRCATKPAGR